MNVRIPESMRDAIDERRALLPHPTRDGEMMSRDQWVANAIEMALLRPPGTPVRRSHVVRPATQRGSTPRAGAVNGQ